jgi:hypothetical protein
MALHSHTGADTPQQDGMPVGVSDVSIVWINWCWKHGPQDPDERYVFLAIADNADADGFAYPSISYLVDKTRKSESSVRRAINQLVAEGWLVRTHTGNGRGNRTHYQLVKKVSVGHPLQIGKGVSVTDKGCQRENERVSQGPKKGVSQTIPPHPHKGVTVIEPSLNSQGNQYGEASTPLTPLPLDADPAESIPDGLSGLQYAGIAMYLAGLVASPERGMPGLKRAVDDAIVLLAREEDCGLPEATRRLAQRMKAAGPQKWHLWLQDGQWKAKEELQVANEATVISDQETEELYQPDNARLHANQYVSEWDAHVARIKAERAAEVIQ